MKRTTILCKGENSNLLFDCDYKKLSAASLKNGLGKLAKQHIGRNITDNEVISLVGMYLEDEPASNVIALRSRKPVIGPKEIRYVGVTFELVNRKKFYEHISNPGREGLMLAVFRAPDAEGPEDIVFADRPIRYRSLFIGVADNDELAINPENCFRAAFRERLKEWTATGDGSWHQEFHKDSVIRIIAALVEGSGDRD